jgi:ABC-type multidrug transport system fused ATPase/permease subunit
VQTPAKAEKKKLNRASLAALFRLAKPERNWILLGTVFLAIGSSMGLLYPQAMKLIIDEAIGHKKTALIDQAAIGMVAIFLIQGIAIGLRYIIFNNAGERVVARLRKDLYTNLLRQEIAFFDERRTGELTNRLGSDTTVLQSAVSANISMALRNAVQIIGGLGFLFYTSPTLTLLMLVVVPPIAIGAVAYGRRVRKLSREVQDSLATRWRRPMRSPRRAWPASAPCGPSLPRAPRSRGTAAASRSRTSWRGRARSPQARSWRPRRSEASPRRRWCSGTAATWSSTRR